MIIVEKTDTGPFDWGSLAERWTAPWFDSAGSSNAVLGEARWPGKLGHRYSGSGRER